MKKIKCSECDKEYDYKQNACPHCGYSNKIRKTINTILYIIGIILVLISVKTILKNIHINKFVNDVNGYLIDAEQEELVTTFKYVFEDVTIGDYQEKYGSAEIGKVAYKLDNIRTCSMCFCIFFIWIGEYLKNKNIKMGNIIKYVAIVVFILFQLIPFFYAIGVQNIRV